MNWVFPGRINAFCASVSYGLLAAICFGLSACNPLSSTKIEPEFHPNIDVAASRATLSVDQSEVAEGDSTTLSLTVRDQLGQPFVSSKLSVIFTLSGGTSIGTLGTVANSGNGTYTTVFTATTAGTALTLSATIDGEPVSGSAPTVKVITGPASIPSVPTSLAGTNGNATTALTWAASTGTGPIVYKIYRSTTNNTSYAFLADSSTPAYTDATVANGTTYYFKVTATNANGESGYSNEIAVRPAVAPSVPRLVGATVSSGTAVLTWATPTTGTAPFTYSVYRHTTSGGPYTLLAANLSVLTYTDTGLTNGTPYYYVVTATNSNSSSGYSNEAVATPETTPTLGYRFNENSSFQPHNILRRSAVLSSTWVTARASVFFSGIAAPDGSGTVYGVREDTTTNTHGLDQVISGTLPDNAIATFSAFVHAGTRNWVRIAVQDKASGTRHAVFDLSTGTAGVTSGTPIASGIYPVGNGWYRVFITVNIGSGASTPVAHFRLGNANTTTGYAGDGMSYAYFWGAQFELNPGMSRYVPTTTTAAASFTSGLAPKYGSTNLSFTRADTGTTASLVGSDGKVRTAPHNRIPYSEALEQTSTWSYARSTITANAATAPDGTTTADKLIESTLTTAPNDHAVYNNTMTYNVGSPITFSVFLKKAERSKSIIRMGANNWGNTYSATVDLTAGTITSTATVGTVTAIGSSMYEVGNGWYRVSVTALLPVTDTVLMASVYILNDAGTSGYNGDGTSGIYVWGAQVEENINASAYLATAASARYDSPRFDFNPSTLKPNGLLIEKQSTNILVYSEDITQANWAKNDSTATATAVIGPHGQTVAKLSETATTAAHYISQTYNFPATSTYSYSIFVKQAERRYVQVYFGNPSFGVNSYANFDLQTGNLGTIGSATTASIEPYPNGWYRLSITSTSTVGGNGAMGIILITSATATRAQSYAGTAGNGVYVYGAQAEASGFPTSYIRTHAVARTRFAETVSVATTGWFNNAAGALVSEFTEGRFFASSFPTRILEFNDGSNANRMICGGRSTSGEFIRQYLVVGSSPAMDTYGYAIGAASPANTKLAAAYDHNDYSSSLNGGTVVSSTMGGSPPSLTTLLVGKSTSASYLNGWIQGFNYYNARLPDADLVRLSQ